ncbi:MAG: DUF362 domain-containing protein [Gemmatimonadales bacterium]|nr:DUF362 domain-containing protein [Gemmatimonadales bacterium]
MPDPTRRDFLKTSALVGGGLLAAESLALREAALASATPPAMSIARWDEAALANSDLSDVAVKLTQTAIESLGGMGRFVNKGDTVWVKPNIGWNRRPELAANTNPDVVAAVVRMCRDAGAKTVKVGDHPCHPARQAYRNSGIAKAVEEAGGKMVYLDKKRFKEMTIDGQHLKKWPLYVEIIEADLVINVPILKHHGLSKASMAMKNYMGIIGGNRGSWHQNLDACLADITQFMKPRISLLDAVRVLTDHGPQGGDPADVDVRGIVAASTDIVALDALGAELLGHDSQAIGNIGVAAARGLGTPDYRSLDPVEKTIS